MKQAVVATAVQLSFVGGPAMSAHALNDFVVQAHLAGGSNDDPSVRLECLEARAEEEGLLAELEKPQKLGYFNTGANPVQNKKPAGHIPQLGSPGPKKVVDIRPIVRIFHEGHSASAIQSMHWRKAGTDGFKPKHKEFYCGKFF